MSQQAREAEIRAVCGEIASTASFVAHGVLPLSRAHMRNVVLELEHLLSHLGRLVDQLP
jgi:hypothetical protein